MVTKKKKERYRGKGDLFFHSFNWHLFDAFYVPGSVTGAEAKTMRGSICPQGVYSVMGKRQHAVNR